MQREYIDKHTIFKAIIGSKLYGTDTPESDTDIRGVCIVGKEYYIGFLNHLEQYIQLEPEDITIYSIQKALKLMSDCNPNMTDLLFCPKKYWLYSTPYWEEIYRNRHLFLSKKAKHTYLGYAFQQLKRLEGHRKWLLNPPTHEPTREEFNLKGSAEIPKEHRRAMLSLPDKFIVKELKEYIINEKAFDKAMTYWREYRHWKSNRNPERAKLEAKVGYDAKHFQHCIRLLKMGKEILQGKGVNCDRRNIDADELRDIRNCKVSYSELIGKANNLISDIEELYINSSLQHKPNYKKINQLCIDVTEWYWNDEKRHQNFIGK